MGYHSYWKSIVISMVIALILMPIKCWGASRELKESSGQTGSQPTSVVKCVPCMSNPLPPPPPPLLLPPPPPPPQNPSYQYCPPPPPSLPPPVPYYVITGQPGEMYPLDPNFSLGQRHFDVKISVRFAYVLFGFLVIWRL